MIVVNGNKRIGKNYQHVWITITVNSIDCQVNASAPDTVMDNDLSSYFSGQVDREISVAKKLYPDAKGSTLAEIEQWIADNPEVEPTPWTSTHPKEASAGYQADLQGYKDSPLYNKTQEQIDSWVDNVDDMPKLRAGLKEITRVLKIMMHTVE